MTDFKEAEKILAVKSATWNLYHVQDSDRPMWIIASGWSDALKTWQEIIGKENDCEPGENDPEGIHLVAGGNEIAWPDARCREGEGEDEVVERIAKAWREQHALPIEYPLREAFRAGHSQPISGFHRDGCECPHCEDAQNERAANGDTPNADRKEQDDPAKNECQCDDPVCQDNRSQAYFDSKRKEQMTPSELVCYVCGKLCMWTHNVCGDCYSRYQSQKKEQPPPASDEEPLGKMYERVTLIPNEAEKIVIRAGLNTYLPGQCARLVEKGIALGRAEVLAPERVEKAIAKMVGWPMPKMERVEFLRDFVEQLRRGGE